MREQYTYIKHCVGNMKLNDYKKLEVSVNSSFIGQK